MPSPLVIHISPAKEKNKQPEKDHLRKHSTHPTPRPCFRKMFFHNPRAIRLSAGARLDCNITFILASLHSCFLRLP